MVMALWVTKEQKQQQVKEYFSSINSMSLRIIEDTQKVRESYGKSWDGFSIEDQEQKIDEWMVPLEVHKQYPLPESKGPDVFPTLRFETGQKIVELHSEFNPNEVAASWRDEHSDPFSFETRSQMDLSLPSADGKIGKRRKSSLGKEIVKQNGSFGKQNGGSNMNESGLFNGDYFNSKAGKTYYESACNSYGISGSADNTTTDSGSGFSKKCDVEKESYDNIGDFKIPSLEDDIKLDFSGNGSAGENATNLPDISFDSDFLAAYDSSKKNHDIATTEDPVQSSGLSKAYNESEFLDLYPQPQKVTPPQERFIKPEDAKQGKKSSAQDTITPVLPVVTKPKKTHRKKSSGGSTQVNPQSSLTLDGAIQNLEIAAEMNKQDTSPEVEHKKVYSNESDLLRQIEKDTELKSWITETPDHGDSHLLSKSDEKDAQKSSFDFLNDW